jgi:hypothetical protein
VGLQLGSMRCLEIPGEGARARSFAKTQKSIREDGQLAGVELKTNRVADGPSPNPRVQFSQCGKEIYLVQIVQILFWGKKRAKVAIF